MPDNKKLPSLDELGRSIKNAKERIEEKARPDASASAQGIGLAWRICIELLAGIAVGCFIGYYLDLWLSTKPVFFILCFLLGTAGSGLNIYRMAQGMVQKNDAPKE